MGGFGIDWYITRPLLPNSISAKSASVSFNGANFSLKFLSILLLVKKSQEKSITIVNVALKTVDSFCLNVTVHRNNKSITIRLLVVIQHY